MLTFVIMQPTLPSLSGKEKGSNLSESKVGLLMDMSMAELGKWANAKVYLPRDQSIRQRIIFCPRAE